MSNTFTTADALATFPNATLWRILGEPHYADIAELYEQCQQNAAAILSSSGRGQHRWLDMIMPAGVYTMYSNTPWVNPIDPGPNIIHPTIASKNEHSQAKCQHLDAQKTFHQMMIIKTALKNLLYTIIWHQGQSWASHAFAPSKFSTDSLVHMAAFYPQELANNKLKIMHP